MPAGLVSIEVNAYSIYTAGGAPAYALVVMGDFTGTLVAPGSGGNSSGQCTITVAAIESGPSGLTNSNPITYEFSTQSGNTNGMTFQCKLGDSNGNLTQPGDQNWTVRHLLGRFVRPWSPAWQAGRRAVVLCRHNAPRLGHQPASIG